MRQRPAFTSVLPALALVLLLAGCANTGDSASPASGVPSPATPSSMATASTSAPPAPATSPSSAPSAPAAPTLADVEGTWCRAINSASCLTVAGSGSDGESVAIAETDEGAPCLTVSVTRDGEGAVAFFCPAGMEPEMRVTTAEGSGLDLDNVAYDRLFVTQAPPYVDTWYREDELAAAAG